MFPSLIIVGDASTLLHCGIYFADLCGETYLYTPGALKSPRYPDVYPNSIDCKWKIFNTDGQPILLQFSYFMVSYANA